MKRNLGLALVLAILSNGALAEWQGIASNDGSDLYIDRTTIRKSGTTVKMWSLVDYKVLQKLQNSAASTPYRSSKDQYEYQCEEEKVRSVYFSLHTEKMGEGEISVSNNSVSAWMPIPPKSGLERMFQVVCGK